MSVPRTRPRVATWGLGTSTRIAPRTSPWSRRSAAPTRNWAATSIILAVTGSDLVVGAPFESVDGVSKVGNGYVYNTASWTLLQTFSGSTASQEYPPYFGSSVAAGGGLIAIGAPLDGTVASSTAITGGAVYVYNATTFGLVGGLTAPSTSNRLLQLRVRLCGRNGPRDCHRGRLRGHRADIRFTGLRLSGRRVIVE